MPAGPPGQLVQGALGVTTTRGKIALPSKIAQSLEPHTGRDAGSSVAELRDYVRCPTALGGVFAPASHSEGLLK